MQPNTATKAYCDYVAEIAAGKSGGGGGGGEQGGGGGGGKISYVCAALAPCMRLYAWLGQTLAKVLCAQSSISLSSLSLSLSIYICLSLYIYV